jgi:hypothetical protein
MFPKGFFAERFFAPQYFAPVTGSVLPPDDYFKIPILRRRRRR